MIKKIITLSHFPAFILALFLVWLEVQPLHAQVNITSNDTSICLGESVALKASYTGRTPNLINLPDDLFSSVVTIPFPFTFYGTSYTRCVISSNGYISFNTGYANLHSGYVVYGAVPNGSNGELQNSIMASFADLYPNNSGDIDWAIAGTAPNRKFVVTWCNMPFYSCRNNFIAMQAILYEGSNIIDIQLNRKDNCSQNSGGSSSGLTVQGLQKDAAIAHIVPGRNATLWSAYQDGQRFTPAGANAYIINPIPYNFISRAAWYTNNTSFLSIDSTITVSPASTTFYVYKTDCADNFADTVTVTVTPAPVIALGAVFNPSACQSVNGSILITRLTANTTYTVTYTQNGTNNITTTGTSTATGTFTIAGLPAGIYSNIRVTLNSCSSNVIGPVALTSPGIPPTPVITASPNPLCSGATLNLSTPVITGNTYSWTGPNGFTATSPTVSISNITVAAAGMYSVIATNTTTLCPSVAGIVTVMVNPTPATPSISVNNPLCAGETLNLSTAAVTGATYSWTGPNGFSSGVQNPSVTGATVASSGNYNVIISAANCASGIGSTTVTVNPIPVIASAMPVNPATCNGANGRINLTGLLANTSYSVAYFKNGMAQAVITITSNASGTVVITGLDAGSYTDFKVTNLNCTSPLFAGPVALNDPAIPSATISAQADVSCYGASTGSATVTAVGSAAPYTFSWSPSGGSSATASGLAAGTYTVTVKDANNCQIARNITINQPSAILTATAVANTTVCAGSALGITPAVSGGTPPYTYLWTGPAAFSANTAVAVINAVTTSAAGTYNLNVTDSKGCTVNASVVVTVNDVPDRPGIITGVANICAGTSNVYRITPVATATSYSWTLPSMPAGWIATSANGLDSLRATAPGGAGAGTISVTAINGCGASQVQSKVLSVTAVPATPGTISGNSVVCGGGSNLYSISPVAQATSYTWMVPAGWSSPVPVSDTFINSTPPASGNGVITVKASNFCGVSAVSSLPVAITSNIPTQPTAIIGQNTVCGGTSQIYSIPKVADASYYNWTITGNGWTRTGTGTDTFVNAIAGTAATTLLVTAVNGCGVSAARMLTVMVTNKPGIAGTIVGPDSVCTDGSVITFSTGVINEATSYTWILPASWAGTSTTAIINSSPGLNAITGPVTVTVAGTNICGTGTAAQKIIIVNHPVTPSVNIAGPVGNICMGTVAIYTATPFNGGASPRYQWQINSVNSGVLTASNTFSSAALHNGDIVSVAMKTTLPCATTIGGWAAASSPPIVITPAVIPGININASTPPDLCRDIPVTFYSNITGGGSAPAYHWYKNGVLITGAAGATYTDRVLNNRDTLYVFMISTEMCRTMDSVSSNKMGVSVSPYVTPVVTISANPGTSIGSGQTVTFTAFVSNGGANPEVRWKRNGQTVAGTGSLTWTTATLREGDVISADLVSGARCATPFLVSSENTLLMHVGAGVGGVAAGNIGEVNLYPNPNTGHFTVTVRGNGSVIGKRIMINIMNGLGQLVYHSVVKPDRKDWSVDVRLEEKIANGIYTVRVGEENTGNDQGAVLRFELRR